MLFAFVCQAMWADWHILFFFLLVFLLFYSSFVNFLRIHFSESLTQWVTHALSLSLSGMASSSRARSSSPFSYRKSPSPFSSTSSTSSFLSNKLIPRSCSSSASTYFNSGGGYGSRSMTPSRSRSDSMQRGSRGYNAHTPVPYAPEEIIGEPLEAPRSGDSISVTIRFRPLK